MQSTISDSQIDPVLLAESARGQLPLSAPISGPGTISEVLHQSRESEGGPVRSKQKDKARRGGIAQGSGSAYSELKVPDLKQKCRERGLVVSGSKQVLIQRLEVDDSKRTGEHGPRPVSCGYAAG
ncbi:hypothetical protein NEOLEDRAFT_167906 [Neolentinus lepideus HHB14362 ss-1]|uniref:SAP domain-containing protein n=1 Tax=Neolentinus lepideus HHB14362 ss-1 TaxID=1314782 RepID=A0A165TWI6_9AGAM|nr:hypothetical protein NEOLEDRAFT_662819 [Neolentinus lepideus HHB14362 ss-1]KZT27279.1 hypothetical protein NEOLEDRAFT_167906 [Neolentinus lepideus HHB14362 ss-1]